MTVKFKSSGSLFMYSWQTRAASYKTNFIRYTNLIKPQQLCSNLQKAIGGGRAVIDGELFSSVQLVQAAFLVDKGDKVEVHFFIRIKLKQRKTTSHNSFDKSTQHVLQSVLRERVRGEHRWIDLQFAARGCLGLLETNCGCHLWAS